MRCFVLSWHPFYEGGKGKEARSGKPVVRQDILDTIDKIDEVANWRASTGSIFIASDSSARVIAKKLRELMPLLTFVLLPIDIENVWGWTDKETWEFIQNPRPFE